MKNQKSPEQRMKHFERDYKIIGHVPKDDPKWKNVKWIDFRIVVPDEETKRQLQAACEYLHNNELIDTDYLAVNSLVHAYENPSNTNGAIFDPIVVNSGLFKDAKKETCIHAGGTHIESGVKYCDDCDKAIEVMSYRD